LIAMLVSSMDQTRNDKPDLRRIPANELGVEGAFGLIAGLLVKEQRAVRPMLQDELATYGRRSQIHRPS